MRSQGFLNKIVFILLWLMQLNENKEIINFNSLIIMLRISFCSPKKSF
jgi:hypothetical protein